MRDERGSGSVLALALVAVAVVVSLSVLSLAAGLGLRQRVIGAADAAALAAADGASGALAVIPCDAAARLIESSGARVAECRIDGLIVTIDVVGGFAGVPIRARSSAGPPR